MASEDQIKLLTQLGYSEKDPTTLSKAEASAEIEHLLTQKHKDRELEKKIRSIIKDEINKLYEKLLKVIK